MRRELWLQADSGSAARARSFVREAAAVLGLDDRALDELVLATSEAVANAVEHGRPCAGGKVGVEVGLEDDTAVIAVHDCGRFKPSIAMPADLESRGRGLPIMAAVVDEVRLEAESRGTVVRLAKRRSPRAEQRSGPAPAPRVTK